MPELLKSRIKERLQIVGLSPRGASLKARLHEDAVRNILRDKSKHPRSDTLTKLAVALECDPRHLITALDEGLPRAEIIPAPDADRRSGRQEGIRVLGEAAAGVWMEVEQFDESKYGSIPISADPRFPAHSQYAILIRGNSINKVAKDGEFLLCIDFADWAKDIKDNDLVLVERTRADAGIREVTIKRVKKNAEGVVELWPESDDPKHQDPIDLAGDDDGDVRVKIKAIVLWKIGFVGPPEFLDEFGPEAPLKIDSNHLLNAFSRIVRDLYLDTVFFPH